MITFDLFWQILYNHGASLYHRHDCFELWNSLSPERQQQLYDLISGKLREGRFVDYNPLRAMQDNLRAMQPKPIQPTNYNGRRTPDEPCVIAIYKGVGGVYTERDARAFNMTIKSHLA